MEKIEVTARSDSQGKIRPVSFVWNGRVYQIDSVGRSWTAKDGFHILVMTPRNRAYHLLFISKTAQWYLIRGSDVPTVPPV